VTVPAVVRPAEAADAPLVRGLLQELGYEARGFDASFARVVGAAPTRVWVAEGDGRVVGVMSLSFTERLALGGTMISIDELVVTASARGRRVGAELVEKAKEVARELGAARVELHTRRSRESYARDFYVKNGFVEVDSALLRWEP
jgi:N-acetylglutamate synthase-like GNAT family acetyltransferase